MTLRILHLEDSALDAELVCGYLNRFGLAHETERVDSQEAFIAALAQPRDVILADYQLPSFDGLQALRIAHEKVPHTPFIFVSGTLGEERAIESLKKGATDYVLKQNLSRLAPAVERALQEARGRREREKAERERRDAENQLRILVAELSHRVGNILAVVQSIARQTLRSSSDLQDFERSYFSRIDAFAKTQKLLVQADWRGASVRDILGAELSPYEADAPRWRLQGDDVSLKPNTALTLALIVHELATNAAKYGALSVPDGHVCVALDWQEGESGERRLRICWREEGGPAVSTPARNGFGSRLIARMARSLNGGVTLEHRPDGLSCTLDLSESDSVLENDTPYRAVLDRFQQNGHASLASSATV
ncbi:MAG TPA: HWE histidine kinase domain-containing protein [Mesorhizobium sp.]|nr:HWE histidine kinase domain-containing protein [Mesorhizobium sp.]